MIYNYLRKSSYNRDIYDINIGIYDNNNNHRMNICELEELFYRNILSNYQIIIHIYSILLEYPSKFSETFLQLIDFRKIREFYVYI